MTRPDVLFVHTSFPAQFEFIAPALRRRGMRCVAIGNPSSWSADIPLRTYPKIEQEKKTGYDYVGPGELGLLHGLATARVALRLRDQGFSPDVIIAHPGWGDTLLLSEVFPKARQILHGEYYYRSRGGDYGFDPEFGNKPSDAGRMIVASKNTAFAMAYAQADRIVSPTAFQARQFPPVLRDRMSIIHEGVDTDKIRTRDDAKFKLPNGTFLDRTVPVITFVNRTFEPLRGFHIFMRALPAVLTAVPNAHVVLIGNWGGRNYGLKIKDTTWKDWILSQLENQLDMSRVHFVGSIPHEQLLNAFNVSAAHVYYTYPFVLSWSLLEAMASECLIIGSDTGPLRDAVTDGVDGRLLDFFDVQALSQALIDACRNPKKYQKMRKAARRTVIEKFDRARVCLPAWLDLIDKVMADGKVSQDA
jgi:glycosyltransferase involved in cell wall biosynthesis